MNKQTQESEAMAGGDGLPWSGLEAAITEMDSCYEWMEESDYVTFRQWLDAQQPELRQP